MQHVKSYGNISMFESILPLSDKNTLSVFHDRTLWPNNAICNTSDQRGKRRVAMSYYVLAGRSSTKHSTQQSGLTLKYWQNASYQLGGMNRLYAVMTVSAHWFNICSHIWEGVRRLSSPPGYVPSNSDWSPYGWGGKPAAWKRIQTVYTWPLYQNFCHPR